jgi:ABC-type multidrug transport system fused ATPase/permease subunit
VLSTCVFLLELAPLELQRRIVNSAVDHKPYRLIVILCLIYLGVSLLHGGIKLVTNVYRGSVGEATNRHLRMQLAPTEQSIAAGGGDAGVRISIIVSEAEAVGGFAGSSFSEPVLNAGILLSVFGYMLYVQPWMALVAFLTQRRIETLRAVSVAIVREAAERETAPRRHAYRRRIGYVYLLNVQIFIRKFGINFLMNLLYSLGVIGILAVGGWLVLNGRTEVGTIVAFISGLNRMNSPWRDLMNWFRDLTNAGTKYRLIAAELGKGPGPGIPA